MAPDGTQTLHNRLISPTRIADVTQRLRIELPGVVQRFEKGHRIRLVLAASDAAYAGNTAVLPVTVAADRKTPGVLTLPVASGPGPAPAADKKPKPASGAASDGGDSDTDPGARPGGVAAEQRGGDVSDGSVESANVLSDGALASTGAGGGLATTALTALLLLLAGGLLVRVARHR